MKGLHFPRYLAYGFGVPLLFILFCVVLDESKYIENFSMQYGQYSVLKYLYNYIYKYKYINV